MGGLVTKPSEKKKIENVRLFSRLTEYALITIEVYTHTHACRCIWMRIIEKYANSKHTNDNGKSDLSI